MYDAQIRAALVRHLEATGIRVVHEWRVGRCVVDVAAITDRLHAYEIKGPRDSLSRLPAQVEAYGRVFDRCVLVAAGHLITRATAAGTLPEWWGIVRACSDDGGLSVRFERVRAPAQNPGQSAQELAGLLYARELRAILQRRCLPYGKPPYGYEGKPAMMRTAGERIPVDELRPAVLAMIASRAHWKADAGRRTTGSDTDAARRAVSVFRHEPGG
jgi:hypothetical protein